MLKYLVTDEGGLTGAGYGLFIAVALVSLVIAVVIARRNTKSAPMSPKRLAFCAMGIALAYVTSYIQFLKLPMGGTVTLFSMLFLVLIGNWYGAGTGILVGLAYGVLQFIQDPYYLTFFQVCCDYLLAFAALGVAGFFRDKKHGLVKGYIAAVLCRGVFASLAGYLYWMEYMPESFPKSLTAVYPIVYNYSYLLVEGILTVILISIPAVSKALNQVRRIAIEEGGKTKAAATR